VISFPSGAPAEAYRQLQQAGSPVVLLNRRVPGVVAPVVRHDFAGGYAQAVQWLAERGHRRIGAILPRSGGVWADHSIAWSAAFERLGLEPRPDLVCFAAAAPTTEATHQGICGLLVNDHPPTALFAATPISTLVALRVIQTSENSASPAVALVGTGDRRWEYLFPPSVPFICLDSFGLGTTAAHMLNDLIDGSGDVQSDAEVPIAVSFVDAALPDAAPSGGA
jgi:LacI family transcriptional regulator